MESQSGAVNFDIQSLKIHANAVFFRKFDAFCECAVHRAELYGVGKFVVMVDDYATIAEGVGMNRDRFSSDFLGSFEGIFEILEVSIFLLRVDEGIVVIAIEAADLDVGDFCSLADFLEVADAPVPEFDRLKTVFLGGGKTLRKGQFRIKCIDAL